MNEEKASPKFSLVLEANTYIGVPRERAAVDGEKARVADGSTEPTMRPPIMEFEGVSLAASKISHVT